MKNKKLQTNYTTDGNVYQLCLPMDIGELIPDDDSVRLLSAVLEMMDYSKLYAAYSRMGRTEISPKRLFKIFVYGYMNGIYSSRKLEQASRRDVNFIYLLGRGKAPDHATIADWLKGAKRVIAVDYIDYRLDHAKRTNQVEIVNFEQHSSTGDFLKDMTGGGADVVIDCVGMDGKMTPLEYLATGLKLQGGAMGSLVIQT